ncbi:MAG: hypothetical protein JW984_14635 [Deltaproteobacteria bacterium]|uniref:Uncharacterized protein n=1 Tax=Candidatus Zymogenus saltonus TaxID=2844893 RepID=A0A9D8KH33_9DELT|nr:hypothetical protein [Candidatus Zymogenus saltonus]
MKNRCFRLAVLFLAFSFLTIGSAAIPAEIGDFTIEICHGGFVPLDRANGMVFKVAIKSDTDVAIKDLVIETKWWDMMNRLNYKHVDNKTIAGAEIACQDTPDVIYITGAMGTIDGVKYDLIKYIRVVRPEEMGIDPGGYAVKELVVRPK